MLKNHIELKEEVLLMDNLLAKVRSLEVCETQATGMEKKLPSKHALDVISQLASLEAKDWLGTLS